MTYKYIIIFFFTVLAVQCSISLPRNTYESALAQIDGLKASVQNTSASSNDSTVRILNDVVLRRQAISSGGYDLLTNTSTTYINELEVISEQLIADGNQNASACIRYAYIWQPETGAARGIEGEMYNTQSTIGNHLTQAGNQITQAVATVENLEQLLDRCADIADQATCYTEVVSEATTIANNASNSILNAVAEVYVNLNKVADGNQVVVDKVVANGLAGMAAGYQFILDCIASNSL